MPADSDPGTRERVLFYLKTRGPQTAAQLARRLSLTTMGVRLHLARLQEQGKVTFVEERLGVGRPARRWEITETGHQDFPEGYADLTVDILSAVQATFGARGLARLIRERTRRQIEQYQERMPDPGVALSRRVAVLAKIRVEEGYMAEWSRHRDGSLTLIENHCPICTAAQLCQGLCGGEEELFQTVLGDDVQIERVEHILAGARRCAYRIVARRPEEVRP